MVDSKSKKIKKIKLDQEKVRLEKQSGTQKQKQKRVFMKLKTNKKHMTISNNKLKKKVRSTEHLLKLDILKVQQAIQSLKKFHLGLSTRRNELVLVHLQLKNQINLQELAPKLIALKHPIREQNLKAIFIVLEKSDLLRSTLQQNKYLKSFEVLLYSEVQKREIGEFQEFLKKFTLKFVDVTIYKQFLLRMKFNKNKNLLVFPVSPSKVPFSFKKEYKIERFDEYINLLTKSTFAYLYLDKDYALNVAQISMKVDAISENIMASIYSLVPHLMANSVKNHVTSIHVSIQSSIKLQIYNNIDE